MITIDSPVELMREIVAAEELRDRRVNVLRDMANGYSGPSYSTSHHSVAGIDGSGIDYNPENHTYEYIRLTIPQLLMDNPRVTVMSRRGGPQEASAVAMKHGMNRWVRDIDLRERLDTVAYDYLMGFGVAMTTRAPNPNVTNVNGDVAMWPSTVRISPRRYFMDPWASCQEDAKFQGHKYIVQKADLLKMARTDKDAGWNLEVLEQMSAGKAENDRLRRNLGRSEDVPNRNEVELYEVWIPGIELEDSPGEENGFHGTLVTITPDISSGDNDLKAQFPRDPRPYYGPRWGPYVLTGVYKVPDEQYPLSPLVAIDGQMRDLNDHALAVSKASRKYKQLVLTDSTDPRAAQKIKDSEDLTVIPVEGLERAKMLQVEVGGASDTQLKYLAVARDRLDRNSGISESMRGNVGSGATATEAGIAERAIMNSLEYVKLQWRAGVEKILKTAGWFLYHDDEIVFPLGADAAEEMNSEEAWFSGGDEGPGSGYTYDDLELQIEAHSMERPDERTTLRRTMEFVNVVAATAPVSLQTPHINWDKIYSQLASAYAISGTDDIFDEEIYEKVVGAMAQDQADEDPVLGKTLGDREAPRARPSRGQSELEGYSIGNQATAQANYGNFKPQV